MSKRNIVLIDHEPYSTRRRELFYIDELRASGYNVAVWDISQLVFPGIKVTDEITESYLKKIYTIDEIDELLQTINTDSTIFLVEAHNCWHNRKLFKLLSKYKCKTVKMNLYANLAIKITIINKIIRLWLPTLPQTIRRKSLEIINRLYDKCHHIYFPDYYLSSSSLGNPNQRINHPDYEKFRFNNHSPVVQNKYIVFLDTYFPFHPDLKYHDHFNNNNITECAKKYHQTLNRFFDFLETKHQMPVIIAAHPKSDYVGNEFNHRQIIKYKTDNLVINSSLVITQTSNAISYIALADKPVIFISTDTSNLIPRYKHMTDLLANALNKKVYNLDAISNYDTINISKIDNETRTSYIYNYLTTKEIQDNKNIEILKSLLEKI